MSKRQRITVRGRQRTEIDPLVFLQVLLEIGDQWDQEKPQTAPSIDVYEAAIEDRRELPK